MSPNVEIGRDGLNLSNCSDAELHRLQDWCLIGTTCIA